MFSENNKRKIGIISIEPQSFTNEKTGVVNEMLKITYFVKVSQDTDRFYGNNVLVSYVPVKELEKLKALILKPVLSADIDERVVDNKIKWVINTINDITLR